MRLDGKVALLTGGAAGIGRAFLSQLLTHGAKVSVCDTDQAAGEALALELSEKHKDNILFLHCDVADDHRFEECFKLTMDKLGGLDLVVNNAGIGFEREESWRRMVDVNLKGAVSGTYLGMRYMAGRGGTVVNVGSTTALSPFPATPVYSATKAALNHFTSCIGTDFYLRRSGVRVFCLNPGLTITSLSQDPAMVFPDQECVQFYLTSISTLRPQSVENVARALLEVLEKAENGSIWAVQDELPPFQVASG